MAVPWEKHERYKAPHKPNDLYWGIGLEEEFYLELEHPLRVSTEHILQNQKQERYSVDYRTSFKPEVLKEALFTFLKSNKSPLHKIPILVNSHSFAATDSEGQPRTTYTKVPQPNPKFSGTSLHELLGENSRWYKHNYNKIFCYDGNTFEIMTQNFYKTTAEHTFEELVSSKKRFLKEISTIINKIPIFSQHGKINYMSGNHGLATYMTNYNQINLCNNGTLHVNLTMPTLLNENAEIADEDAFKHRHIQSVRLIQWLEPLLLAIYGEPDFLSSTDKRFSSASQRGAISRYISIANYDTNEAKEGKHVYTSEIPTWYKTYHDTSAYRQLEKVGFDIQFRKFPKHGLELRIFDRLPDSRILPLVRFLVLLLDRSIALSSSSLLVKAPQTYASWNGWLIDVLLRGPKARADAALLALYEELIGCKLPASGNPNEIYLAATAYLEQTYAATGECSMRMLKPLHVSCANKVGTPECKKSAAPLHVSKTSTSGVSQILSVEKKSILCCY
jgi:hypothetical protein